MSSTAWAVVFLVIGLALIGLEAFTPGGILGAIGAGLLGGAVAGLFFPGSFWLAFTVAFAAVAAVTVLLLTRLYQQSSRATGLAVGAEAIVGKEATVVEPIEARQVGKVRLASGEVWSASSAQRLEAGTRVIIERLEGVRAVVRPAETSSKEG